MPVQFKLYNEDFNLLLSRLEQVDDYLQYSSFSRRIMEVSRKRYFDPYPILPNDSLIKDSFFPISCWRKGIESYFEDIMHPTENEFDMVQMVYGGDFCREQTERWKARR